MRMYYINCGVYNSFFDEMMGFQSRCPQLLSEVILCFALFTRTKTILIRSSYYFIIVANKRREISFKYMGTDCRFVWFNCQKYNVAWAWNRWMVNLEEYGFLFFKHSLYVQRIPDSNCDSIYQEESMVSIDKNNEIYKIFNSVIVFFSYDIYSLYKLNC